MECKNREVYNCHLNIWYTNIFQNTDNAENPVVVDSYEIRDEFELDETSEDADKEPQTEVCCMYTIIVYSD